MIGPGERAAKLIAEVVGAVERDEPLLTVEDLLARVPNAAPVLNQLFKSGRLLRASVIGGPRASPPVVPHFDDVHDVHQDAERVQQYIRGVVRSGAHEISAQNLITALSLPPQRASNLLAIEAGRAAQNLTVVTLHPESTTAVFWAYQEQSAPTEPGATGAEQKFHLVVENFRRLRQVDWSPSGVCLLAGPNGAGKSTMLEALTFLQVAYQRGVREAARNWGTMRRVDAETKERTSFQFQRGLWTWYVEPQIEDGLVGPYAEERLMRGDEILLERLAGAPEWYIGNDEQKKTPSSENRSCLRMAIDAGEIPEAQPLVELLNTYRCYRTYSLNKVREASPADDDTYLLEAGQNLVALLASWHGARTRFEQRFAWVEQKAREALPDTFSSLEFDRVGNATRARFFHPHQPAVDRSIPLHAAADGLLVTLLHLAAVAGAPRGGIVAIDEVENNLHPHAIRTLIEAFRERAEEQDLTILLTTHSPVVMNCFRENPEQLYVVRAGHPIQALTELKDPDWLAHFSLGSLYESEQFGAPTVPGKKGSDS